MDLSNPQKAFLRVQANSIEGGTTNIMKNILGERVLGLPGEPRVDKDLPWSEVPRSYGASGRSGRALRAPWCVVSVGHLLLVRPL